jgi:hypothetical protein
VVASAYVYSVKEEDSVSSSALFIHTLTISGNISEKKIGPVSELSTSNEESFRNIISNYLSVISFLVGSSSFVLGLYGALKSSTTKDLYYKTIVICIALPALILIIIGISLAFNVSHFQYYLAIFGLLFVPITAILILTYKL